MVASGRYSTAIRSRASVAVCSSFATTAATGSPTYRTCSGASGYSSCVTGRMPKLTGKSLPVRTRCTPGCDFAFSMSIFSINACGCGLRSILMCTMRGRTMSSAKRVCPVTLARPSTRRRGLPRTFIAHPSRRFFYCFEDLLVAGASAQIAGDGFFDPLARRRLFFVEKRFRGHQDARRAIAALRGAEVGEGRLQRMQLRTARQTLHRIDQFVGALHGENQAGKLRLAVDEHGAGAAFAELAAVLGAGKAEILAQHFEQRLVRCERRVGCLAVYREYHLHVAPHCLAPKQSAPTLLEKPQ